MSHNWRTDQVIKYVPLVNMNSDEGLILGPLHSPQILCSHIYQCVEQVQEMLIGFGHNAAIIVGVGESFFRISCPNHLDSKQANLDSEQGYFKIPS